MKSSKAKMIDGEPYQADGRELYDERIKTKQELYIFNNLDPSKNKQRNQIIKRLFAVTGSRLYIEPPFRCDYGYNIEVGENFYSNYNLTVLDSAPVRIGINVFIGPNVSLFTSTHPIHHELRNAWWEIAKPITIGDNVWLGGNTVVNPGVTIGQNTVIGSGSVVTKDLPDNVVAAGNPCRVLRPISEHDKQTFFL